MADFEKLSDNELDKVSGGQKFFIGGPPVSVYDRFGNVFRVLYREKGDFFVTDGTGITVGNVYYAHVYLDHGDGYVDSRAF